MYRPRPLKVAAVDSLRPVVAVKLRPAHLKVFVELGQRDLRDVGVAVVLAVCNRSLLTVAAAGSCAVFLTDFLIRCL